MIQSPKLTLVESSPPTLFVLPWWKTLRLLGDSDDAMTKLYTQKNNNLFSFYDFDFLFLSSEAFIRKHVDIFMLLSIKLIWEYNLGWNVTPSSSCWCCYLFFPCCFEQMNNNLSCAENLLTWTTTRQRRCPQNEVACKRKNCRHLWISYTHM